jgi:hypothetical protein
LSTVTQTVSVALLPTATDEAGTDDNVRRVW